MSMMNLWERVKEGRNSVGEMVTLRRRPVTKSPSGRFVFEYNVIYLASGISVRTVMSRKNAYMAWDMEMAQ